MSFYWLAVPPIVYLAFKYVHFFKYFGANVADTVTDNYPIVKEIYQNLSYATFFEFIQFKLRQYAAKHLESGLLIVKKDTYELIYYNDSIKYVVVFPKKRGPCPFSEVFANDMFLIDDVTEKVRMYAGPSHNFHGIQTTPAMLGFEDLRFNFRNGTSHYFRNTDVITLDSPLQSIRADLLERANQLERDSQVEAVQLEAPQKVE
jgi:hypothetical protein